MMKQLNSFFEMVEYEGYTLVELEASAGGGGGKVGGGQTYTPPPINTTSSIGNQLDAQATTFEEETGKEKAVDKAKLGTRGLQIPLAAATSTTNTSTPSGGVQV